MNHPRRGLGKLLGAVLVACYGILAVAATGPHTHDLEAADSRQPPEEAGASVVDRPASGESDGRGSRPAHCGLCAWGRGAARPANAASANEVEPPQLAPRPAPEVSRAESPQSATALLRAPPGV